MRRRTFLTSSLALPFGSLVTACGAASRPGASGAPFRLLVGGDTNFAESYDIEEGGQVTTPVAEYGYAHSLERLAPLLKRADYTVLNLETALTRPQTGLPRKAYRHWSDADKTIEQLRRHGVDAVGLANNHTLDFGMVGLRDTFAALHHDGIKWFGAGANVYDASLPLVVRVPTDDGRDRRVAFFGMFEYRRQYDTAYHFYASARAGGTKRLDVAEFARMVRRYRRQHPTLFVIAYAHWGRNYDWRTDYQNTKAKALIDAGADMVIGHHAHVLQEIEQYRGKWILYGIGNFMFNAPGRFAGHPNVLPYGLAVELLFPGSRTAPPEPRLYPILSNNAVTGFQPRLANAEEFQGVFDVLARRSDDATRTHLATGGDDMGPFIRLGVG